MRYPVLFLLNVLLWLLWARDTVLRAAHRRMQEALIAPDSAEELRAAELARTPREDSGTGDDPLGDVVPSGHGLDADAGSASRRA